VAFAIRSEDLPFHVLQLYAFAVSSTLHVSLPCDTIVLYAGVAPVDWYSLHQFTGATLHTARTRINPSLRARG